MVVGEGNGSDFFGLGSRKDEGGLTVKRRKEVVLLKNWLDVVWLGRRKDDGG